MALSPTEYVLNDVFFFIEAHFLKIVKKKNYFTNSERLRKRLAIFLGFLVVLWPLIIFIE